MKAIANVIVLLLAAATAACDDPRPPVIDDADAEARARYPDLQAVYAGDQGLYRGCGPNGGVCHNGNEFPNLDSLGSIVANIDVPCNQKRDRGDDVDDLCERPGDRVQFGEEKIELAYFEPHPAAPLAVWRMVLRDKPAQVLPQGEMMQVWRAVPGTTMEVPFLPLALATIGYLVDPDDPTERSILIGLPQDPALAQFVANFLTESSVHRPDRIHGGDVNKNGTFGAELGGRLIRPGDPERSYLLRRLTDPTKGPLMPRANCCSWTRTSLRALWCWVDGLAPDGANAEAPIDYDGCRPSPPIELLYPDPGPACEAQGLCPVQFGGGTGDASFGSIYAEILTASCAGAGCHDQDPIAGGVDLRSEAAAYETLLARVVPGDSAASLLWQKLNAELCTGTCDVMPLGRAPLAQDQLDRIRTWITDGAPPP